MRALEMECEAQSAERSVRKMKQCWSMNLQMCDAGKVFEDSTRKNVQLIVHQRPEGQQKGNGHQSAHSKPPLVY